MRRLLVEPQLRGGELNKYQEKEECEDVKCIAYWDFDPKDWEKCVELTNQLAEERKKDPKKYPTRISENYSMAGEHMGFILYEVDKDEQITNLWAHYFPFMVFEFVPIFEAAKTTAAIRQRMKK